MSLCDKVLHVDRRVLILIVHDSFERRNLLVFNSYVLIVPMWTGQCLQVVLTLDAVLSFSVGVEPNRHVDSQSPIVLHYSDYYLLLP